MRFWRRLRRSRTGVGVLIGIGIVSVAGAAFAPLPGVDWRVLSVDSTGTPLGTVGNPVNVTGGGGGGGLSVTDGAAWTAGMSAFTPSGGVFNDSATALTSGQQGSFRTTPNRALHVNLRSQNGTEQFPAAAAMADSTGNPTVTGIQTFPMVWNSVSWDRWKDMGSAQAQTVFNGVPAMAPFYLDTTGTPSIRRAVTAASTTGGVAGTQVPSSANTVWDATVFRPQLGDTSGRTMVVGAAASGASVAGNPVLTGRAAVAHGSAPSTVTAGQAVTMIADRAGVPFTIGGHPNVVTFAQQFTTAQTDTALVTIAAGNKIVVTSFMVSCSAGDTVNVSCRLGFGTASTPAYGSNGLLGTNPGIAPGSGFGRGNGAGIVGVGADDEDLRFTCSAPTSGAVDCDISYYVVPS